MKANFRTIRTQVLQPASAGNVADMSELQAQKLRETTTVNSALAHCVVWVSYQKIKPSLQELSQLSCWLQVF